jgi:5-methylcytosine-specific restriction enzyme A
MFLFHSKSSIIRKKLEMELSNEILEEIFQITRQVDRGDITLTKGRNNLVQAYGFNANSANMTIRSLRHMLNGEPYRRALAMGATDYFLNRIREECGKEGLCKALVGLSAHIDYRHSTGVNVPGLQTILAKHSK